MYLIIIFYMSYKKTTFVNIIFSIIQDVQELVTRCVHVYLLFLF